MGVRANPLKLLLQAVYVAILRAFENVFGQFCIGKFNAIRGVWENFSGEVLWPARRTNYFEPATLEEIIQIVKEARKAGVGVRVVGSGHSFNNLTEPSLGGMVINLSAKFNKVLKVTELTIPEPNMYNSAAPSVVATATVQGGKKLKDLCYELSKLGYGVHNMGNYYEQTVAGVVSTGTHGTTGNFRADTFTSIIVKLQLVNGKGEVEEIVGGADSISLGAFGVVTAITLKLVPMYWLQHDVIPVRDIVKETTPGNIKALLQKHNYVFFRWATMEGDHPSTYNRATIETFNVTHESEITPVKNFFSQILLISKYYVLTKWFNDRLPGLKQAALFLGSLFPSTNIDAYFLAYAVPGVVAAHVESEWALPIEKTNEAVAWISENLDRLFGSNTVEIHVRFVPKDGAYLSPAHAGDSVYIDANLPSTLGFSLEPFYRKMQSLGGRPHWSKMHDLDYPEISQLYDLARFKELCVRHDPDNIFGRAPYLRKVLGTPAPPPEPHRAQANGVGRG